MIQFSPQPDKASSLLQVCFPYDVTPLSQFKDDFGQDVFLKDETNRMELCCFKGLGGIYAVAALIGEQWTKAGNRKLAAKEFLTPDVRSFASTLSFVCASAGNHGLAVAKGASIFGANAIIYLSKQVPMSFEIRLVAAGAQVIREGDTYEQSCDVAKECADQLNMILLADSSWEGYTYAPSLVMEGYTVLAEELRDEFETINTWPTHVYLQAGVGGMAAAITHMIRANWHDQPEIFIVEPQSAQCLQQSHLTGRPTLARGPKTSMERLDCKIPSIIACDILKASDVKYLAVSDEEAKVATDYLRTINILTTPSGAAGLAALKQSQQLGTIQSDGKALVIITEADVQI